jgi:hypothetical protein
MTWRDEPYLDNKGFGYDLLKQLKEKTKVEIGFLDNFVNILENLISQTLTYKILVVSKLDECISSFMVPTHKTLSFLIDNLLHILLKLIITKTILLELIYIISTDNIVKESQKA